MNRTKIEYLTHTWNPLAMRCTPISEGCENCWHLAMANRLAGNDHLPYDIRAAYKPYTMPCLKDLTSPIKLKSKNPARIGVQFMGDLFHRNISREDQDSVVDAALCSNPKHQFYFLTKRAYNLFAWYQDTNILGGGDHYTNLWWGITAENQKRLDERLEYLLKIPGNRWISFEPLLSPIKLQTDKLSWVVVGCESGPGRRPMKTEWAVDIVRQCESVPVFVKQIEIDGKISHNPEEWPKELRRRELPFSI